MNSKDFVTDRFNSQPKRYGVDDGDLNIVNDYFIMQGWQMFTREQFAAIASLIRTRNKFLANHPNYDLRKKHVPAMFVQLSIYDFLDDDTATQTKKLARYFAGDEARLNQSNSRIKSSVRNVDNEHITAAKIMLPLFISEPKLKKMRISTGKTNAIDTGLDDDLGEKTQANAVDGVAGE